MSQATERKVMNQEEYEKWKVLQNRASDTMIASADARLAGDYQKFQRLYEEAIKQQEVANKFLKSTKKD